MHIKTITDYLLPGGNHSRGNIKRITDYPLVETIEEEIFKVSDTISPVENKDDLELDFKVFFFTDSCCSDIVHDESN